MVTYFVTNGTVGIQLTVALNLARTQVRRLGTVQVKNKK